MEESKKISLTSAVLMSINIMIGAGIFIGPQIMAQHAGTMSFLGWLFVALLLSPIIVNVAQASRMFPGDGGFYHYSKSGLGETMGFMAAWACFMGYLGSAGVQVTVIKEFFMNDMKWQFVIDYPILFIIGFLTVIALLCLLHIQLISKIQSSMTVVKLFPLFFVISLIFLFFNPDFQFNISQLSGIGYTIPVCIFAYNGWEACCSIGHLIKGGSKNVPFVLFTAFAIVVTLYTLFHLSILYIMGIDNLLKFGAVKFPQFLGFSPAFSNALQSAILYTFLLSYVNAMYGISVANIANLQVLAEKNYLFGQNYFLKLNKNDRPYWLVIAYLVALFTLVLVLTSKSALLACTGVGITATFILTLVSMLATCYRNKEYSSLFRIALGLGSCAVLLYFNIETIGANPTERLISAIPIVVIALFGYVMFRIQRAKLNQRWI